MGTGPHEGPQAGANRKDAPGACRRERREAMGAMSPVGRRPCYQSPCAQSELCSLFRGYRFEGLEQVIGAIRLAEVGVEARLE